MLLGAHLHTDPSVPRPSSPQSPGGCAGTAEEAVESRNCWVPAEHTMIDLPAGARAALGTYQKLRRWQSVALYQQHSCKEQGTQFLEQFSCDLLLHFNDQIDERPTRNQY